MILETRFYSCGIALDCSVCAPDEGDETQYPMVLLCHGHSRNRNDGLDALADFLAHRGIASMRFNLRGCGASAANRYRLLPASEMQDDIAAAIAYARSLPIADGARLGMAGISLGAILAVEAAASLQGIRSVAAMSCMADCAEGLRAMFRRNGMDWDAFTQRLRADEGIAAATGVSQMVNRMEMFAASGEEMRGEILDCLFHPENNAYLSLESVSNFMRLKPIARCGALRCPIFYLHGGRDALIDPQNAKALFDATGSAKKKLRIYPDMEHNMPMCAGRDAVFADMAEWFLETLV